MLLDMLNRPIKSGDTVLVKGYGTTGYIQATIDKVARVNVYVRVNLHTWECDMTGTWVRVFGSENKRMARHPSDVIVVNEQLAHNKATWPELQL